MEIVKRGINPDIEWWHGRCTHCKSEMKEQKKCLKIDYGDIARAICPVCQYEFILYPPVKQKASFDSTYDWR